MIPGKENKKAMRKSKQERKELMHRLNGSAKPFRIEVWDAREKRTTHSLSFVTKYEAQDYLNRNTLKRATGYYHKDTKGRLDMELEYTLKNN